jgi:hypothetical protein
MAKKDKKKSKKKATSGTDPVGAVRTAVERTFQATADSAQSTRTRAQDLVDEVAGAAGRLREMIEHVGVLEDLKKQVDSLARRVQALEGGGGASKPAAQGRSTASGTSRSTSSRATGARAKSSGATARKPAASRAKAAPSKPASSSRSTSSRSTSSGAGGAGARKSPSSRSSSAKKTS